ncbi:hemerythrin domain-containing protein [Alteromonas flava]|uniref:hemerythrin domain-containing protein n=1 Tax=Alteromonas flava TaxID=2048003 RepID=UPI000C28DDF7|nr:hemerythrin domain-containing protein [Alteromonas flava]
MQIFEAIRQDHERQRLLMKILVQTSGATEARKDYFDVLKKELKQHEMAEERYFYKPLMDDDKTIEESRHGIAEHHEIDELIEALDDTDMSSPVWLKTFKQLKDKVEHHLNEEEQEFFQKAGRVLDESEKEALAEEYRAEMEPIRA